MAITPQEAIGSKLKDQAASAARLEEELDKLLVNRFDGEKPVNIDVPTGYAYSVVDRVLEKFREKGWCVKRWLNGHNEMMIEFKPDVDFPIEQ